MLKENRRPQPGRTLVLYDRACPLCNTEMHRLKRRDRRDRLCLVDISESGYETARYGFERAALLSALHVRTPSGQWLIGMPAIRHVYRQVGLGWLIGLTEWPPFDRFFDALYPMIAANRVALSRWLRIKNRPAACTTGVCAISAQKEHTS